MSRGLNYMPELPLEPPRRKEVIPVCPVCGMETDTAYYNDFTKDYVGCHHCITAKDAYDTEEYTDYDL